MKERRVCARCGTEIKRYAGRRLCPNCLLRSGLSVEGEVDTKCALASVPFALPHSFGDYELLDVIAQGGMGIVYRARQKSLHRIVAVKMLLGGEFVRPKFVERFRAEAEAAAQLQHPNIVAIHEIGEQDGQPYFSMDYIEGKNLAQVSAEFAVRSAESRRCAGWLKTMAEAVHYAHQHGIIHRDLKPSNVLIDPFDQPRITDFGLAKRISGDSELTLTGQVLGSPNYLPPEQASGQPAGIASDVYSLGAILYHLLTGRPPFEADSLTTLLRQVMEAEPVPLRALNPGIPRDLETIALKCLEKEPHRRYPSAQELAADLGRFLEERPILALPVGPAGKAWKWCRRLPALAGLGVGLLLAVLLGSTGVLWEWHRAMTGELLARQKAEAELQQRQRAEASEYAADMHLAQLALSENNRGLALTLLDKYRPRLNSPLRTPHSALDLRGWEWRYLWRLCQGDEFSTLHRYPQSIDALVVSKDGKLLALATGGQVALWDLSAERLLTVLSNGLGAPIAFAADGSLLAMGRRSADGPPGVVLWDVKAEKTVKALTHTTEVLSIALAPDGKLLATFDSRGSIHVVEWASERTLTNLNVSLPRYGGAGVVAFSPDGHLLAVGEDHGRVRLLDLRSGSFLLLPAQLGVGVRALAFSPTGDRLAAAYGYGEGTIRLWDPGVREPRGELTNHTADVSALAFTPDGKQLVSASFDWSLRMWDVTSCGQLGCLWSSRGGLTAVALLPDGKRGKRVVTGGTAGSVCFWDPEANGRETSYNCLAVSAPAELFADLPATKFMPPDLDQSTVRRFGVAFTPDSRRFVTMDIGGFVVLGDARSLRLLEKLPEFSGNHWGVALSPDGHWLATGDSEGRISIWDWATRSSITNFAVPFEWFGLLSVSPSGHYLTASIYNNDHSFRARVWHTEDWSEVPLTHAQSSNLWLVAFAPDDRRFAGGYGDGTIKLFRFPSGQQEACFTNHHALVSGLRFSPDGGWLYSVSHDGSLRFWDVVARREQKPELRGHLDSIWGSALSRDGRRLVTVSTVPRDAVKLWDVAARREVLSLRGVGAIFCDPTFSPDGNTIAAVAMTGIAAANLWRAPSWEEIEMAERAKEVP